MLADHFSYLKCMQNFDISEALHQWNQVKFELRNAPFFNMAFTSFWKHVTKHYDTIFGYNLVLILARVVLIFVVDTSCCERGYSAVNHRMQTKQRVQLKLTNSRAQNQQVRSWTNFRRLDVQTVHGRSRCSKGRQLSNMVRTIRVFEVQELKFRCPSCTRSHCASTLMRALGRVR